MGGHQPARLQHARRGVRDAGEDSLDIGPVGAIGEPHPGDRLPVAESHDLARRKIDAWQRRAAGIHRQQAPIAVRQREFAERIERDRTGEIKRAGRGVYELTE